MKIKTRVTTETTAIIVIYIGSVEEEEVTEEVTEGPFRKRFVVDADDRAKVRKEIAGDETGPDPFSFLA